MKNICKYWIKTGILIAFFCPFVVFSQAGLTNSGMTQQQEMNYLKSQSGYGFDTGSKGGSALEQLENMAGSKVDKSGSGNGQLIQAAARATAASSRVAFENSMKMMVASSIASMFLSAIFSDNSQSNQRKLEEQRAQAALLAQRAAAEKRYNDSLAQVKYEVMMKSYKMLNDPNGLQLKNLSSGNLNFKTLDTRPAPLTMEERERQKLIRMGLNVTWDYNSWALVPTSSNKIIELPATQEVDASEKWLNDAINKIETFQGGRIAALSGRFIKNIKNETMSYIQDASNAAISGNIAKMDEAGNFDLRKITSNAIYKTGAETANAYIEQGKDFISGKIQDANFAVMKSGGQEILQSYKIYAPVSNDWKMSLKN